MNRINYRIVIHRIETFKRGAGVPLKNGTPIRLHYSIALNVEDINAEKFIESSYLSNRSIYGIIGKDGSLSNIVNTALEGQNALCTVRVQVRITGYATDVPRSVLLELWPDTQQDFDEKNIRFRKVNNYLPSANTTEMTTSSDTDRDDYNIWIRHKLSEAGKHKQAAGYVVSFTEEEISEISKKLETQDDWVTPKHLGDDEYLLTERSIILIKERLL
jgi:hypothetical protein